MTRRALIIVLTSLALTACGTARASAAVVGSGTPASCTSAALVAAVAAGGQISFDCGPAPATIDMTATAKVVNTSRTVVLDGGGKVTLSGEGTRRILYMDTCDKAQIWATSHCEDQATPELVVNGLTFTDGDSAGDGATGGGAIYAYGGRLEIEHSTFTDNRCAAAAGSAVGGGAVSAQWQDPAHAVQILDSTFTGNVCDNPGAGGGGGAVFASQDGLSVGGSTFTSNSCAATGPDVGGGAIRVFIDPGPAVAVRGSSFSDNQCSNGAALSSIQASWSVASSSFTDNHAIGIGANPPAAGTPGGGSGGAIYNDGDTMHLAIDHSVMTHNTAREGGGAIFFVSNDRTGTLSITDSKLIDDPSAGFETPGLPGIFFLGAGKPKIVHSVLSGS